MTGPVPGRAAFDVESQKLGEEALTPSGVKTSPASFADCPDLLLENRQPDGQIALKRDRR